MNKAQLVLPDFILHIKINFTLDENDNADNTGSSIHMTKMENGKEVEANMLDYPSANDLLLHYLGKGVSGKNGRTKIGIK